MTSEGSTLTNGPDADVEVIRGAGGILAYIIRATAEPTATSFITPDTMTLQTGFVVYPAGGTVQRHLHRPLARSIVGTGEVLLVRRGRCEAELYDEELRLVATRTLETGDVIVLIAGGHGFSMLEDTVLLEVKQGPYTGLDEKERF